MQLITFITDKLKHTQYTESQLKALYWRRDVNTKRLNDYGNMSVALHRLMKHGVLTRFTGTDRFTNRPNYFYKLAIDSDQLDEYIKTTQAKVDAAKARKTSDDSPTLPMEQIRRMYDQVDDSGKRFLKSMYPDAFVTGPVYHEFDNEWRCGTGFGGNPVCVALGLASENMQGKELAVYPGYQVELVDRNTDKVIFTSDKEVTLNIRFRSK